MHASAILLVAAAGYVAAQTTTSAATSTSSSVSGSGCGSQIDTIIASCLGTTEAQLAACAASDWDCMCTQTTNVLTCYNNCPSDPNRNGVLQQQTSYCNAASAYPSTSTTPATRTGTTTGASTLSTTASGTVSEASSSVASSSVSGSHTATGSAAAQSSTGAAIANVVAYPGLLAAFFGLAAML